MNMRYINLAEIVTLPADISSKIFDFIIYSNIFISIGAMSITYIFFKLMGLSLNYVLLIPFFIMFFIYSFNRKTDVIEDSLNNPEKSIFNKKYSKYLLFFSVIAYALITLFGFMKGARYGMTILAPFLIGILYSERIVFKSRKIRLKDMLYWKNLIVAATWAYITIGLPSIFLDLPLIQEVCFLGFIVFMRVLIDEIFFDIKDVEGDAKAGVKTIPVVYGIAFTDKLLIFLNIAFTFIMVLVYLAGNFRYLFLSIVLFTASYGFFYLCYYKINVIELNKLSDIIVGGEYIAAGILVYLITI